MTNGEITKADAESPRNGVRSTALIFGKLVEMTKRDLRLPRDGACLYASDLGLTSNLRYHGVRASVEL